MAVKVRKGENRGGVGRSILIIVKILIVVKILRVLGEDGNVALGEIGNLL